MTYTDSAWGYDAEAIIEDTAADSAWGKATVIIDDPPDYDNVYWYDGATTRRGRLQYFDGTNTIDATGTVT